LEALAPVKNPDLHSGVGADTLAACMETDAISNSESSALRKKKKLFSYTNNKKNESARQTRVQIKTSAMALSELLASSSSFFSACCFLRPPARSHPANLSLPLDFPLGRVRLGLTNRRAPKSYPDRLHMTRVMLKGFGS
jgi:hypothetical protein